MRLRRDGVEIAWSSVGAGPALLLVHAFPLDRTMWNDTAEALAARHRVITFDVRGFGESQLAGAASLETIADDAAAVLDAAGAPMAAVGGLSMGGYVALAFARRHASRLAALVLADTRAAADPPDGKRARDEAIARMRSDGVEAFVAPQPARLLSPGASPALRDRALAIMRRQSADGIANALAAMRDRPDRTDELAGLSCPTLVLVGSADALTPPAEARSLAARIRGARLHELDGAGHLSNLEAPAAFHAALAGFLDEAFPD
jgi:pimeloyl-ACP methyl ester carboxylesterase